MLKPRPRVFWWMVGTPAAVFALVATVWLLVGWRYVRGVPTPRPRADVLAELRLLGSTVGLDPGKPAFPVLQEALNDWGDDIKGDFLEWNLARSGPLSVDAVESVARAETWLADDSNVSRLQRLVEVLVAKPTLGFVPKLEDALLFVSMTPPSALRDIGHLMRAEFRRALRAGDALAAEKSTRALLWLAVLSEESPCVLGFLGGGSLRSAAFASMNEAIGQGLWGEASLSRLQNDTAVAWERASRVSLVGGQRLFFNDVVGQAFTGAEGGPGRITPTGLKTTSLFGDLHGGRVLQKLSGRELPLLDRPWPLFDLVAGPLLFRFAPGREEAMASFNDRFEPAEALFEARWGSEAFDEAVRRLDVPVVAPPEGRLEEFRARLDFASWATEMSDPEQMLRVRRLALVQEADVLALQALLSAERFRVARGRFPATVAEAREAGFGGPETAGFAGPIRLLDRDGRLLVYADGADGDDDGGFPPEAKRKRRSLSGFPPLSSSPPPAPDGDVVFFGGT